MIFENVSSVSLSESPNSDLATQNTMFPPTLLYLNGYEIYEELHEGELKLGFVGLTWLEKRFEQP